jgi:hypothetical protein
MLKSTPMEKPRPLDRLATVLFEGQHKVSDFKTMPGTRADLSQDELAVSLLRSMERMGLVKDGQLVDISNLGKR